MDSRETLKDISTRVDELAHFINFRRKSLATEVQGQLGVVDQEILVTANHVTSLEAERRKLEKARDQLTMELESMGRANQDLSQSLKDQDRQAREMKATKEKQIAGLEKEMVALQGKIDTLKTACEQQKQTIEELAAEGKTLGTDLQQLRTDHDEVSGRLEIVSKLLSAHVAENQCLKRFKNYLYDDFLAFANREASLDEEAKALMTLQSAERDLEMVTKFPGLLNKSILAIGGGFSSGKSAFVNSFMAENKIRLPEGTTPMTAIATYVVAEDCCQIRCYSGSGGYIYVPDEVFRKFSHAYVKSFGFNLKKIMPFMTVSCPLPEELFANICIIDTPGYNPAVVDGGFTEEDRHTAEEFIDRAHALIWMIGLDASGTFPASDLEFLSNLNLEGKQLFIIANKADLKSDSDLEDVLDEFEGILDDEDVEYVGISAYSARLGKEYKFRRKSLNEFLSQGNERVEIRSKIKAKIDTVLGMYDKAFDQSICVNKEISGELRSLNLDLIQSGFDFNMIKNAEAEVYIEERISKIEAYHKTNQLKEQKKILAKLGTRFHDIIDEFFLGLPKNEATLIK